MKRIFCLLIAVSVITMAYSQIPDAVAKVKTDATAKTSSSAGKLLTQFGGALKTTALTSAFTGQKTSWLAKAGRVSDAVSMGQSIASLAGGIKPTMFKSGFNVGSLIQTAGTVQTLASAGGLLKNLEVD